MDLIKKPSSGRAIARPLELLKRLVLTPPPRPERFVEPGPVERRVAEAYLQQVLRQPEGFVGEVSAEDEMYLYLRNNLPRPELALHQYMHGGNEAIEVIENIARATGKTIPRLRSMLDFACGYGKSTRFLVQRLDPRKLWVSDIYRGAVDFQRAMFGVRGFYSAPAPREVKFPRRFELVYVGSLFSHLPQPQFKAWLLRLYELLDPDGVLIFSTQGPTVHPLTGEGVAEGFQFSCESESRSLDKTQYGSTVVTEAWVRRVAAELGIAHVAYLERELWAQDVFVVTKPAGSDLAALRPNALPLATIEGATLDGSRGELRVSGWALDRRHGAPIARVRVLIDGHALGDATLGHPREDVAAYFGRDHWRDAGWHLRAKVRASPTAIATVLFESRDGAISCLAAPLDPVTAG